jgi:hypothetical protein
MCRTTVVHYSLVVSCNKHAHAAYGTTFSGLFVILDDTHQLYAVWWSEWYHWNDNIASVVTWQRPDIMILYQYFILWLSFLVPCWRKTDTSDNLRQKSRLAKEATFSFNLCYRRPLCKLLQRFCHWMVLIDDVANQDRTTTPRLQWNLIESWLTWIRNATLRRCEIHQHKAMNRLRSFY